MITLSRESVARRWRGAWREVLTQLKCPSDARGGWGRHCSSNPPPLQRGMPLWCSQLKHKSRALTCRQKAGSSARCRNQLQTKPSTGGARQRGEDVCLGRLSAREIPPPASSPTPQRVRAVMELLVSPHRPGELSGGYPISRTEQASKGDANFVAVPLSQHVPRPCPPAPPRSPRGTKGRSRRSQGRSRGDAGVMAGAAAAPGAELNLLAGGCGSPQSRVPPAGTALAASQMERRGS